MIAQQTRTRVENPARWRKAAERAIAEDIQVRQIQSTGQWIASSGTQSRVAYELCVTGNVAHGCDCLAGLNGDAVCKHKAAFYLLIGALDLTPEPDPPAPASLTPCAKCNGGGVIYVRDCARAGWPHPLCPVCHGTGEVPSPADCPTCAGTGTLYAHDWQAGAYERIACPDCTLDARTLPTASLAA